MNSNVPRHDEWREHEYLAYMAMGGFTGTFPVLDGETFGPWGVGDPWSDLDDCEGKGPTLTHLPSGRAVIGTGVDASRADLKRLAERLQAADVPTESVEAARQAGDEYEAIIERWKEEL